MVGFHAFVWLQKIGLVDWFGRFGLVTCDTVVLVCFGQFELVTKLKFHHCYLKKKKNLMNEKYVWICVWCYYWLGCVVLI